MHNTRRGLFDCLILFIGSLFLFCWGMSNQEIFGFDSRFYLFVQEMWRHGPSLFPLTYDVPYPDYPATSTFVIYLAAKLFGGVNKFVAVLPTALLSSLTLTFTYLIGGLHDRRWGLNSAFIMLMIVAFVKAARSISLDLYPAMFTACVFYLIYSSDVKQKPLRLAFIFPILVLSFAFRGPIGLVIPAGVICSYYFLSRDIQKLLFNSFWALILLLSCSVGLLILAYFQGGIPFMHEVLRMEVSGRMNNHFLPAYFYFTDSFKSYAPVYPLSLLVLLGAGFYAYKDRFCSAEMKLLVKLAGWVFVIMIGMSIPDDKKVRYILPMLPALALMAAYPFTAPVSQKYFAAMRWVLIRFFLVIPIILVAAAMYVRSYITQHMMGVSLHTTGLLSFLMMMQLMSLFCFYVKTPWRAWRESIVLGIAALCFSLTYLSVVEPVELYVDKGRDFIVSIEAQRIQQGMRLAFYKEQPDGLPIKYLINELNHDTPIFIENNKRLLNFSKPAFIVASEAYFNELPYQVSSQYRIVAKDKVGHVPVVVFVKNRS